MELQYYMPTKVILGQDVVKENSHLLKELGRKALVVTGPSATKKNGALDDVIVALEKEKIEYVIFDAIEQNPATETIEFASQLGKEHKVEFVIGVGGGSPLDAAKAIGLMIYNKELTAKTLITDKQLDCLPIVAIPTTSGTGSEVTQYSIITDHDARTKKNIGQNVFPHIALLDARYTQHMPDHITKATAVDALTHLVESYLSKKANFISDCLVESGLVVWGECIEALRSGHISLEEREKLMIASTIAGIAIAQTGTSLPHGMGYHLTYFKDLPHGFANGVLQIEYYKVFKDQSKVEKIHKWLGLGSHIELENLLRELIQVDIRASKDEITSWAKGMVDNKAKLQNHPEEVSFEEIYDIYANSLCQVDKA